MAIGTGQALLLQTLAERGAWAGVKTVCELGAQVPVPEELTLLFASFGKASLKGNYSAKEFYEYLGATQYASIDFNGENESLVFDLNRNLRTAYGYNESFSLVTNFGTSSVVFNQFEVFRNIHQLCDKGGYMLHTLPAQGWGRRWFFKYDANFVDDLAAANDYQVLFLEPFLRFKSYFRRENRTDAIQHVITLCAFVRSKLDYVNSPKANMRSVDLEAQLDIENRSDVNTALAGVGKGDSLFNITLACLLKKNTEKEFVTPILSMYRKYSRLPLST
jgi:hypothetical protein